MLFNSSKSLFLFIEGIIRRKPKFVFLSSFNITSYKNESGANVANLFDELYKLVIEKKTIVEIHIGYSMIKECTPGCIHCKEKFTKAVDNYEMFANKYPLFNIVWHPKLHSKLYYFQFAKHDDVVISGGINLTNSDFTDFSMVLPLNIDQVNFLISDIRNSEKGKMMITHERSFDLSYTFKSGKYKDNTISDVLRKDIGYLKYLAKQGILMPKLDTIIRYYEMNHIIHNNEIYPIVASKFGWVSIESAEPILSKQEFIDTQIHSYIPDKYIFDNQEIINAVVHSLIMM